MRKVFFENLKEVASKDKNIFLLSADLGATFFSDFKSIDPQRFINVGAAEQNMIGVGAGLSMLGKNVYCYSIIPFLIMRTFEQIRIDLCYNNLSVKLLGSGGGLVYGFEGITHHAIEDIAIMRSLPNMTVVAPGDAKEAECLAKESVNHKGPLYIRFGRDIDPVIHNGKLNFKIGKGIVIKHGKDVCLIAAGTMLYMAKLVSEDLQKNGIDVGLISMHTIKPLDKELIQECAKRYKAIFTLEDHNIIGGLGSAVSEVLAETEYKGAFKRIGIPDRYSSDVGRPDYLLEKFGLDLQSIVSNILKEYKNV